MKARGPQLDMFGPGATAAPGVASAPVLGPAPVEPHVVEVARKVSPLIRMGTSTWSFPGWGGLVYSAEASVQELARNGLSLYAQHPLLRMVGVDRTFYAPLPAEQFAHYAQAVPSDFRFLVKAQEILTLARFPHHPRYGAHKGQVNPQFLDAAYAREHVVKPYVQGLGERAGTLVFQFPPQDVQLLGGPDVFADAVGAFLDALPVGPTYAVEVRNAELLTPRFALALCNSGAVPVMAGWRHMPSLREQAQLMRVKDAAALVVRWMLNPLYDYDEARARYSPFGRLVDEDLDTRKDIATLAAWFALKGRPAYIAVNNKAEGSAPLSIFKLADAVVERQQSLS